MDGGGGAGGEGAVAVGAPALGDRAGVAVDCALFGWFLDVEKGNRILAGGRWKMEDSLQLMTRRELGSLARSLNAVEDSDECDGSLES